MASKRKSRNERLRCDVRAGAEADGPRCNGTAAFLGVDDDGETYYFCGGCMPMFEGGMSQMHELPRGGR